MIVFVVSLSVSRCVSVSLSLCQCCSACQNNYVSVALPVRIIMSQFLALPVRLTIVFLALPVRIIMSLFLALPVRLIMSLLLDLPVRIIMSLFLALPVKILLHHFKPVTSHSIRCRLIHCYNVKNQPFIVYQYTCFSTQKNYFSPFHFLTDTYLYSR